MLYVGGIVLVLSEFIVPGGICGALGGILIVISGIMGIMVYPEAAMKAGTEGTVVMEVLVSDSGTVDSLKIYRGW